MIFPTSPLVFKRNSKRRCYQVAIDCCLSISSLVTGNKDMTKPQMSSCEVISCPGSVGRPGANIMVIRKISWSAAKRFAALGHPAHSSLCKESPAELMLLTFVWDKTASGTARSKNENGLHSSSACCFCIGQDCSGTARNKTENIHSIQFPMLLLAVPEAVSSNTKKNKEQISCAVYFLCCSSLSQGQSCPIQKWGDSVPSSPSFTRNGCTDAPGYSCFAYLNPLFVCWNLFSFFFSNSFMATKFVFVWALEWI